MSPGTTPVVGITTYREQSRWGVWDAVADVLHAGYAQAVEAAGGAVVLLPPAHPDHAPAVIGRIDALVVAGGADVSPERYGAEAHPRTGSTRPDRDAWELALLTEAARLDLPTLMVCRGMQLEAARVGGTLDQHTPDVVGHDGHAPAAGQYGDISVTTVPGTTVGEILGPRREVRCHHHQSVRTCPGLVPSAYAEDGTVEAFEHPDRRFWVGVQWHPETQADVGLLRELVAAAEQSG
jgi:putative glutamine amidotransferase